MPRYYFIVHSSVRVHDPAGQEFENDDAAIFEAVGIVRELKRDYGVDAATWRIEVMEGKRLVIGIDFDTVE